MKAAIFVATFVAVSGVSAAKKASVNNTVEHGVNTECKTCPYSLCTNKAYYDGDEVVTLTCYTHGTEIDGNNIWLQTNQGCYVTQYDLLEYNGSYVDELKYCGKASEVEHLTKQSASVKYYTECNVIPKYSGEVVSYLSPPKDLTVTCWTDEGTLIIDDSTWLKTTSNCYVAQIGMTKKVNKATLDNCGPIPFKELNDTVIDPPDPSDRRRNRAPVPEPRSDINKRYLVNFTVGEEYARCYSEPRGNSTLEKRYEFNHEVRLQCYVNTESTVPNEGYWMLTTDWCYVREVDFWESLFDQYRFPACSLFEEA